MPQRELKEGAFKGETGEALELDLKELSTEGEFEGYASTFGNVDRGCDIVEAGAFAASLRKRVAKKVKMLLHHDTRRLCGVWDSMAEDGKGLKVKGRLLLSTQDGKETYELMRAGALDAMSIGYRTLTEEYDRTSGVRRLKEVDLLEVSIVTFPMNERATISGVKDGKLPTIRELERTLMREAGLSAVQAKALLGGGYKSLEAAARDAGVSDDEGFAALKQLEAVLRG